MLAAAPIRRDQDHERPISTRLIGRDREVAAVRRLLLGADLTFGSGVLADGLDDDRVDRQTNGATGGRADAGLHGARSQRGASGTDGADAAYGASADHGDRFCAEAPARLVTLTGPGGVGKTRLARGIAEVVGPAFPDGVHLVSLAAVTDPGQIVPTIAKAIGVRESDAASPLAAVAAHLGRRRPLLVLDNFEQLAPAAAILADLLDAAPAVRLLVTSRSLLRLSGEHHQPVPRLACPKADATPGPDLAELAAYPAVQLFVERARAATGGFALSPENAADVAAICARLDGLPLAIELAAARLRHLPLATVRDRLARPLALLTGGPRDQPARQQALRDTIAWSYDLLDAATQARFARLAVFAGGWTPEAAATVVDCTPDADDDALDWLAALVDDSLVVRGGASAAATVPAVGGVAGDPDPRFGLLETIREFAAERLVAGDDDPTVRRRHADYYLSFAERARLALDGPEQARWLDRLAAEHDNLRAALAWSVAAGEAATALRLGAALWRFWAPRGHLREGRQWLQRALALETVAAVAPGVRARALHTLGNLCLDLGDHAEAGARYADALAIWRPLGDQPGIGAALTGLGLVAREHGDLDQARDRFAEGLAIWRARGDRARIANASYNLGTVALAAGDDDRAHTGFADALAIRRDLGDTGGVAFAQWGLATVARNRGELTEAEARYQESITLFRALADRQGEAHALVGLGRAASRRGDAAEAAARLHDAIGLRQGLGDRDGVAECVEAMALVAARAGESERAARLAAAATALGGADALAKADRDDRERTVASLRHALGPVAFDAAWAAGATLSLDQAAAEALAPVATCDTATAHRPLFGLTPREREVLDLLASHLTDAEIADRLYLSPRTVGRHVGAILGKLGAANRRQAAAVAARHGLA